MPNRVIRESCRESETLSKLSHGAERMFWRMLTYADDFGRWRADACTLRAVLFPRQVDEIGESDVAGWVSEWVDAGLACLYRDTAKSRVYGYFPTFDEYQPRRAKHSKHPDPHAGTCEHVRTYDDMCEYMSPETRDARRETRDARHEKFPASPTASGPKAKRKGEPGYVAEAAEDWSTAYGGVAHHGRIGSALKPLVKEHGWDVVRPVWQRYLTDEDPQYASPQRFASQFGVWAGQRGRKSGGGLTQDAIDDLLGGDA